jgi:homoserine dehydrogenase
MAGKQLNIGLLGCGTVGRGLLELLDKNRTLIRDRSGVDLNVSQVLVRDLKKERPGVNSALLTTRPDKVIENGCDMVVELVGGLEPARSFIHRALAGRKQVVTANKALLAADGFNLLRAAARQNVRFGFEASVCGGIPIVRALRSGLVGNQIHGLSGILNGTCNYILTRMADSGVEFTDALREAQAKGFAEADPTLDIDGYDAAQKLKILAELAFNGRLETKDIPVEGIGTVTAEDVRFAREIGCVIRQVATAEMSDQGLSLRVETVLLPHDHQLAAVRDENNAVLVRGDAVGEMLFSGKGAGSLPSASAVLSDIVEIARHDGGFSPLVERTIQTVTPDRSSRYYLRFQVDEPSAIGPVITILERNGIAVARAGAIWAKTPRGYNYVKVLTHACPHSLLEKAVREISAVDVITRNSVVIRVAE